MLLYVDMLKLDFSEIIEICSVIVGRYICARGEGLSLTLPRSPRFLLISTSHLADRNQISYGASLHGSERQNLLAWLWSRDQD